DVLSAPESPDEALRWALEALTGQGNPRHVHVVALNAALVLRAAGRASDLAEAYEQAQGVIMDGQAAAKFAELRRVPSSSPWGRVGSLARRTGFGAPTRSGGGSPPACAPRRDRCSGVKR